MLTSTPRIRLAPTTGIIIGCSASGLSGEDTGVVPPLLPALWLLVDGDEPRDIPDIGDVA